MQFVCGDVELLTSPASTEMFLWQSFHTHNAAKTHYHKAQNQEAKQQERTISTPLPWEEEEGLCPTDPENV